MKSRYPVRWTRRNGETIAIEHLSDVELAAARHILEREDPIDPIAAAMLTAVTDELRARGSGRAAPDPIGLEEREAA
jgi:hypothetical protein